MQAAMPAEYVLLCTKQDRTVVYQNDPLLPQGTALRAHTMCQSDAATGNRFNLICQVPYK